MNLNQNAIAVLTAAYLNRRLWLRLDPNTNVRTIMCETQSGQDSCTLPELKAAWPAALPQFRTAFLRWCKTQDWSQAGLDQSTRIEEGAGMASKTLKQLAEETTRETQALTDLTMAGLSVPAPPWQAQLEKARVARKAYQVACDKLCQA